MRRKIFVGVLALGVLFAANAWAGTGKDKCVSCHEGVTPGVVKQWHESAHSGSGVMCFSCHEAEKTDPSGRDHNGYRITPMVTPKHCQGCHPREVEEFRDSMHDEAGLFSLSSYGVVGEEVTRGNVTIGETGNYKTHFSREGAEAGKP